MAAISWLGMSVQENLAHASGVNVTVRNSLVSIHFDLFLRTTFYINTVTNIFHRKAEPEH